MFINYILPIALQQALLSYNMLVDNFIAGTLGSSEISALGSASRLLFIIRFSILAFAIGNSVISTQNSSSEGKVGKTLTISILSSLVFSIIFIISYFVNRSSILNSFSISSEVNSIAGSYIDITIFSSLTLSFILSIVTSMRSLSTLYPSLIATTSGIVTNVLVSNLLLTNSAMPNVVSIAWGTIASEVVILLILILYALNYHPDMVEWSLSSNIDLQDVKEYLQMSLIILASHIIWAIHVMLLHNLYGKLGPKEHAAFGIIAPIETLLFDLFSSLGLTALVLIGRELSKDENEKAYLTSKKMILIGVLSGIVIGSTIFLASNFIPSLYNIDPIERDYATYLLKVYAIFSVVKIVNSVMYNGVLRAGGDVTFITVVTTILAWGLIIPISYIGTVYYNWNIQKIYLATSASELVSGLMMMIRFRSKRWMNNLAKD